MIATDSRRRSWLEGAHDLLVLALVVLRPLIWSGDGMGADNLAYLWLIALGCLLLAIQAWRNERTRWSWQQGGLWFAALCAALMPAVLRSSSPSLAWGIWGMLTMHLALAAYLMQVIEGRRRLVFAGLVASLALVAVLGVAQRAWVLPAMTTALHAGDLAVRSIEDSHGDLAERLSNGGVFATFTLANNLAAYLMLSLVPLIGAVLARGQSGPVRLGAGAVALLALVCGVLTGAKGAVLALLVAGCAVAWWWRRPAWGWTGLAVLAGGLVLALGHASLEHALAASAQVRLGYWQGALHLIAHAPVVGHGLGAFAQDGPAAMPLWAEPARYVHNEVLETWVDGGLAPTLVLIALLARLVWVAPTPWTHERGWSDPLSAHRRMLWACAPLVLVVPLFCLLGMLASTIAWLPGASDANTWALWVLAATGVLIAVGMLAWRLTPPPPWAWQLALGAFVLHTLIDFDLHCPGLWGELVIIAVLIGRPAQVLASPQGPGTTRWLNPLAATAAVMVLVGGLWIGQVRVMEFARAEELIDAVAQLHQAAATGTTDRAEVRNAVELIGSFRSPDESWEEGMKRALVSALALTKAYPRDNADVVKAISLFIPGRQRLDWTQALTVDQPANALAHVLLGQDLSLVGRWDDATAQLRHAVRLAPANLGRRRMLEQLYRQAADAQPEKAAALRALAEDEHRQIDRLLKVVNPRNLP